MKPTEFAASGEEREHPRERVAEQQEQPDPRDHVQHVVVEREADDDAGDEQHGD
jgi:hypothetical protein